MPYKILCVITLAEQTVLAREYFNIFSTALEADVRQLSRENGEWFEPAKILIDRENYTIKFGYSKNITQDIFHRTFREKLTCALKVKHNDDTSYIWNYGSFIFDGSLEQYNNTPKSYRQNKLLLFNYTEESKEEILRKSLSLTRKGLAIREKCKITSNKSNNIAFFQKPPIDHKEFIEIIFKDNNAIYFGEFDHYRSLPHTFIVEHAELLKENGVCIFFTELFYYKEHQALLDNYQYSEKDDIPIELIQHIKAVQNIHHYHKFPIIEVLQILKKHKIRIVGIDHLSRVIAETDHVFKSHKNGQEPVYSFNYFARKIIARTITPGNKFIVNTGLAHTGNNKSDGLLHIVGISAVSLVPHETKVFDECEKSFQITSALGQSLQIAINPIYRKGGLHGHEYDFALVYPREKNLKI